MNPYPYPYPTPQYNYQPGYQPYYQSSYTTTSQPVKSNPITGRVVNSADDITVQEVPTDGSLAWFPSSDGSCVYAKRWTPDGNITTLRFVPECTEQQTPRQDKLDVIDERISGLYELVEDISDHMPRRQTRKAVKDES